MANHSYYVVMIDYGRRGLEAVVDPEITRREVVARIASGEYPHDRIAFIHHIDGFTVSDVTSEIVGEVTYPAAMAAIDAALAVA